jgi:hypothetical protein
MVCHRGVLPQHQPPTTLQADTCRHGSVMVFLVSSPLPCSSPLPPVVISLPSCCHLPSLPLSSPLPPMCRLPSLLSLSPLPLVIIPPPTLQAGACSGSGGGITPIPLSHRYRQSTCNPPHEQLLMRLGVGGVLCCWSSPGIIIMPPSSLS